MKMKTIQIFLKRSLHPLPTTLCSLSWLHGHVTQGAAQSPCSGRVLGLLSSSAVTVLELLIILNTGSCIFVLPGPCQICS